MQRRSLLAVLSLVLLAGALSWPADAARPAPIGSDPWRPGQVYRGDFPDPSLLRVGATYYAYATTTAGLNLPVLTSTDLTTWRAAPPRSGPVAVDAMDAPASWAHARQVDARKVGSNWAPSVAWVHGRYLLAYATRTTWGTKRMCISVAVSRHPRGPFVDHSTGPLVCPKQGAIDPQVYLEGGHPWLLWKTEDISRGKPTRLWIRRLGAWGLSFPTWTEPHRLLTARMAWERRVVENPAMIRYRGVRYLFYSGNGWGRPGYAVGYAICRHLTSPCNRVVPANAPKVDGVKQSSPLLATGGGVTGPGGGSPLVTPAGVLRLAYHSWDEGITHYPTSTACLGTLPGCPQRRLHVATLAAGAGGLLTVTDLGLDPVAVPGG